MSEADFPKSLWELDAEEFEELLRDPLATTKLEQISSLWPEIEPATGATFTEELALELVQLVDTTIDDAIERTEATSRRDAERMTNGVHFHLMEASALLNRMHGPFAHVIFDEGGSDFEHTSQSFVDFDFDLQRIATSAAEIGKRLDDPQVAQLCRIGPSGKKGRPTNEHVDRFVLAAANIYEEAAGRPTANIESGSQKIDGPFPRFLKVLWRHCFCNEFRHYAPCSEDAMLRRARDVSLPMYRRSKKLPPAAI